jgi:hypothetical protein
VAAGELLAQPLVGGCDAFLEPGMCLSAERGQPADIEQLARGAVGARGVEADLALEPDHAGDEARQFRNGHVAADADIDGARIGIMSEQEHERIGAIVDVQEFPARRAGPPDRDLGVAGERRGAKRAERPAGRARI